MIYPKGDIKEELRFDLTIVYFKVTGLSKTAISRIMSRRAKWMKPLGAHQTTSMLQLVEEHRRQTELETCCEEQRFLHLE